MKHEYLHPFCRARIIEILADIAQAMTDGHDLQAVMDLVIKALVGHMEGTLRVLLTIYDKRTNNIFLESAYGLTQEEKSKGVYRVGEGITGLVIQTGKSMIVPDIDADPGFVNKTGILNKDKKTLSFICVPIKFSHEVMGALSTIRPKDQEFSLGQDQEVLSIIAAMIAQSVQLHRLQKEEYAMLKEENRRLHEELEAKHHPSQIIGQSKVMHDVFRLMSKVYSKNTPVLILGESGTGKELVAQALHYQGNRKDKAFIRFNCASLPENLVESELFGHEKGSYTGASARRIGRFEEADKGTLFMDEVGELSLAVQAKLLRVLQAHEFERVGGNQTISVDVRIIAATNRDLPKMIKDGEFREDLYYRLNVFPIIMPALRERGSDIMLLADFFVDKYATEHEVPVRRISTPAIDALIQYHWPGNVRELENVIERAVLLAEDDGVIHSYHLPPSLQTPATSNTVYHGNLEKKLDQVERETIIEAIKAAEGNMAAAARDLGVTERIMALRMKKHDIDFRIYRKKS